MSNFYKNAESFFSQIYYFEIILQQKLVLFISPAQMAAAIFPISSLIISDLHKNGKTFSLCFDKDYSKQLCSEHRYYYLA